MCPGVCAGGVCAGGVCARVPKDNGCWWGECYISFVDTLLPTCGGGGGGGGGQRHGGRTPLIRLRVRHTQPPPHYAAAPTAGGGPSVTSHIPGWRGRKGRVRENDAMFCQHNNIARHDKSTTLRHTQRPPPEVVGELRTPRIRVIFVTLDFSSPNAVLFPCLKAGEPNTSPKVIPQPLPQFSGPQKFSRGSEKMKFASPKLGEVFPGHFRTAA